MQDGQTNKNLRICQRISRSPKAPMGPFVNQVSRNVELSPTMGRLNVRIPTKEACFWAIEASHKPCAVVRKQQSALFR